RRGDARAAGGPARAGATLDRLPSRHVNGLSTAARRVSDHARSVVQLELRLAAAELKRKVVALAAGIALVVTAAVLGLVALLFAVAAAAAGIATALPVWQALLVMFGGLVLLAVILGAIGARFLRKGAKPVPEKAIEEARLTTEALRNGH
ncbi:MAG TPA: phage holin family protein, partial [Gaiellaceae bacterium]